MTAIQRFRSGLRRLLHRTHVEQELDEELRDYLERAADDKASRGLSREAAVRAARLEMGSPQAVKDAARDVGWESAVETLWLDVRYALRNLRRSPGFTAVAVITLGLGIGATTAMFSAVNSVLLRALPYRDAEDILVLKETSARSGSLQVGVSAANMRDVAAASKTLSHISVAEGPHGLRLLGDGNAVSLRTWLVSEGFFDAMGGRAVLGRTFRPEEVIQGSRVVVLSYRTWQTRFGSDAEIVGREVVLDGSAHSVVGVLPPDFKYPFAADAWSPRPPQSVDEELRGRARLHGVARLVQGATPAEAQAELDRIAANLAAVYPGSNSNTGFRAIRLQQALVGEVESPLMLLLGAVGLVLLIAAVNVAGLQLARGAARSREYALRAAIGASSRRILRLVCVESLVLAGAGGLVGIGLAYLGVDLIRVLAPDRLPRIDELRIDATVLLFALAVAVASGITAGIAPALRASRLGLQGTLSEANRGMTPSRRTGRLRDRLVTAEIALALVLTVGAGLLVRSFDRLLDNELGFDPANRVVAQVWAYDDNHQAQLNFFQRAIETIGAAPRVEAVGLTTDLPLADGQSLLLRSITIRFRIDDRASIGEEDLTAAVAAIDAGYADSMGIALRAGRNVSTEDHSQSVPVLMVNEAFVRRYLSGRNPVGERITLQWRTGASREIVGVLADVRRQGFASDPQPEVYVPLSQEPSNGLTFVVKTSTDAAAMTRAVQEAIWAADPRQAIWAARPMTDLLWDWMRQRQFNTALLVAFASLALSLAGVGVYGLMSFSVQQRVHELGIRRALGGRTRDILGMILGRALALTFIGVGLGLLGSVAVTRLLQGMLFGIDPFDPATFAAVSMFVVGVTMIAALVPALRAVRIQPIVALRVES